MPIAGEEENAGQTINRLLFGEANAASISSGMTRMDSWMPLSTYEEMQASGRMVERGGGGSYGTVSPSPTLWPSAEPGWVYVEFDVPTNSILKSGGPNGDWYRAVGPNANSSTLWQMNKQGGVMLPEIQNLSPILYTK